MPDLTDAQRERVLTLAGEFARAGRTAELLEFLDYGVPVDLVDGEGNSLLMLAAYHGRPETVAALLARDADPDLRNGRDQAPIAGAIFKGEDEVVRLLVDAGADIDAGTPSARRAAAMFGREHLLSG